MGTVVCATVVGTKFGIPLPLSAAAVDPPVVVGIGLHAADVVVEIVLREYLPLPKVVPG